MIINFEQTPEEFYRLAQNALEKGDLGKALVYCERSITGKGHYERKLTLADIFLRMGRYYDAMDVALEVLLSHGDAKEEVYELMARATGATGKLYESVYYISEKARLEGDDAALDAIDELMEEMEETPPKKHGLFVVGEEPEPDRSGEVEQAAQMMFAGKYEDALRLLSVVKETSEYYDEAMELTLKCYVKLKETQCAMLVAKEQVSRDPKNAFALYVLVGVLKDTSYLPLLAEVDEEASSLYYAVAAADAVKEYSLAKKMALRLVAKAKYSPEAYFVAAGAHYNAREREKGEEILKDLFSLYKIYPSMLILDGLKRRRKHYDVMFGGTMPEAALSILRTYVRKRSNTAEDFARSLVSDADFRRSLILLFRAEDEEVVTNAVAFMGELKNKDVDRFFDALLLRPSVGNPMVKREILAERLLNKHKGMISVVPNAVITHVNCVKPARYGSYPDALKLAYVDALSFVTCAMNVRVTKKLSLLTEKCFEVLAPDIAHYSESEITVALICMIMPTPTVPIPGDLCEYVAGSLFGMGAKSTLRVRQVMEIVRALR